MTDAPKRIWLSDGMNGIDLRSLRHNHGGTEYVRADAMATPMQLLRRVTSEASPLDRARQPVLAEIEAFLTTQGADHAQI